MDIPAKILGSCTPLGYSGAIAIGVQHLIAVGNDCFISIIVPESRKLSWAPEHFYHDAKNPYNHRLASADTSGRIIIWNVLSATPLAEAIEQGCEVNAMHWITYQDISRDLLAVLHSKSKLILWNAQTCTPLWKKSYYPNLTSVSFDPFSSQNLIFNDFSWNSAPLSPGREMLVSDPGANGEMVPGSERRKRLTRGFKTVIGNKIFGLKVSKNDPISSPVHENPSGDFPLQIIYHNFRKQHVFFVYRREIVVFDLILSQPVGFIHLGPSSASFLQVYSCRQSDALICLHQNESLSFYYHVPTLLPEKTDDRILATPPTDFHYIQVCESLSLRRGREFRVNSIAVDPTTELDVTVATSDGRLQFLSLEPSADKNSTDDVWPSLNLGDTIKSLGPTKMSAPGSLRFRLGGFYAGGYPAATVCSVCPPHFLSLASPCSSTAGHDSLIAVGTMRGTVQIWDMNCAQLWREYLLLNWPIRGLTWSILPASAAVGDDRGGVGLVLFAHGWQTSADASDTSPVVKNSVVRLDLETGRQQQVLSQCPDARELNSLKIAMQKTSLAQKPSRWLNAASAVADSSASPTTPIRIMSISNLGQYLSILYENWPLEIWDAKKLVLLKTLPAQNSHPVALTWSTLNPPRLASSSESEPTGDSSVSVSTGGSEGPSSPSSASPPPSRTKTAESYSRETFILCTSPVSLKLFTMDGPVMDSMPISSTIVQSLPPASRNGITCAAWRSPMIAFGMSDGCVAVRNLQSKDTLARYMGVLATGVVSAANNSSSQRDLIGPNNTVEFSNAGNGLSVTTDGASAELSACVKKVEFIQGFVCRLLVLCRGCVAVWEPIQMVLLCVSRFGSTPSKVLIDAAWTSVISSPASPAAHTCALLALDGSLRLATTGSATPNSINDNVEKDEDLKLVSPVDEYLPTSQFGFESAFSPENHVDDLPLLPSLMPTNVALTLRHLLQHQPWHSNEESHGKISNSSTTSNVILACPQLSTTYAKVQSSVDQFFSVLRKERRLCAAFESGQLTIAERCLLTAQLFRDTYEMAFWRVVASKLLPTRFTLTSLVWDELAERQVYRATVLERVNRLMHEASTPEQNKLCTQFLIFLGFRKHAIRRLAEALPDSASFNFGVHRAALLASQDYVSQLEQAEAKPVSVGAPADVDAVQPAPVSSAAKLNHTSSLKLLAATLISNNHLYEGVEMLCILGMHVEACRYLATYGEWGTAIWLAKCMLSTEDCEEVMRQWAVYLATHANRKSLAILVFVHLGEHEMVLTVLQTLRQHQLAARYLEACLESGALIRGPKTEKMCVQVFLEFARSLSSLGHRESACYYAGLAGDLGEALREEIDFLLN